MDAIWEKEEQTEGKLQVLEKYLNGWLPKLARFNGRVLYVDGFAGPGSYMDGSPGSPIVALKCIKGHTASWLKGIDVQCLFIESDRKRSQHLESEIRSTDVPDNVTCTVVHGEFSKQMRDVLDRIDEQKHRLAPAFVLIDPFGVKGNPMELIERILGNPKCECMISFMYEPIRRFKSQPEFKDHLDDLFGSDEWTASIGMEAAESKQFLHGLFKERLKVHGAKYVLPFELWRGERHIYTLYYATQNLKGCDLMKSVMWKCAPAGDYRWRGRQGMQPQLFDTDIKPLAKQLREEFSGRWVTIEEVEKYVMSDATLFHKGQLRNRTLKPLEKKGLLTVHRPNGGRGFTSNKGIQVWFH